MSLWLRMGRAGVLARMAEGSTGGLLSLALAAGMVSVAGCEAFRPKAKDEGYCDADRLCPEGKICVPLVLGGLRGRCVQDCASDEACPKGERCTGRYRKIGTVERFCRQAAGGPGDICTAPLDGCKEGLRCFAGRCERECKKDGDCPGQAERCLPVVVDAVVEKDRQEVFSACLPATQAEGKSCKASGPFCGRGLVCHGEVCTRTCQEDSDCPKGRVCDGTLYVGPKREERAGKKAPPDVRYCRQGAKRNQPCHHHLDVGCVSGLSCVGFRCRKVRHVGVNRPCHLDRGIFCQEGLFCHAGACRMPCLSDSDCEEPPSEAAPGAEGAASTETEASSGEVKSTPKGRRVRRRPSRRSQRLRQGQRCQDVTLRNLPVRLCM